MVFVQTVANPRPPVIRHHESGAIPFIPEFHPACKTREGETSIRLPQWNLRRSSGLFRKNEGRTVDLHGRPAIIRLADTRYRRERNSCRVQAWLGLAA
jgi:hypothetical protein